MKYDFSAIEASQTTVNVHRLQEKFGNGISAFCCPARKFGNKRARIAALSRTAVQNQYFFAHNCLAIIS